jgi:hypothetical protein
MNVKTTLLGMTVLAVLAAGAWWARSLAPSAGPPSPSAGQTPMASARQAGGDDALPDVTLADGSVDAGGVQITLSLSPNPPVAFAKTLVRVRAGANASPAAIENGRVSFEMAMPMGDHRYTLVAGEEGWLEAAVVLPT